MTTTATKRLFECEAATGHDSKGWRLTDRLDMSMVRDLLDGYCKRDELQRGSIENSYDDGVTFAAQVCPGEIIIRRCEWGSDGILGCTNTKTSADGHTYSAPYRKKERRFKTLAGALAYLKREVEAFQEVRGW